jgi:hypothetical protein
MFPPIKQKRSIVDTTTKDEVNRRSTTDFPEKTSFALAEMNVKEES